MFFASLLLLLIACIACEARRFTWCAFRVTANWGWLGILRLRAVVSLLPRLLLLLLWLVQMWQGRAESPCRCGRGEPSPGADVVGGEPSPAQNGVGRALVISARSFAVSSGLSWNCMLSWFSFRRIVPAVLRCSTLYWVAGKPRVTLCVGTRLTSRRA